MKGSGDRDRHRERTIKYAVKRIYWTSYLIISHLIGTEEIKSSPAAADIVAQFSMLHSRSNKCFSGLFKHNLNL